MPGSPEEKASRHTNVLFAAVWAVVNPHGRASIREEVLLAMPPLVVLTLVSAHTGFTHHLRCGLPVYPFPFISASRVVQSIVWRNRVMTGAWVAACCAVVAAVGTTFPHCLSYFNELAGGARRGSEHLIDSNIDWGQDLFYLRQWQQADPSRVPLGLAYSGQMAPEVAGIDYVLPPRGELWERQESGGATPLQSGWYAISVSLLRGRQYRVDDGQGNVLWTTADSFRHFERWKPSSQAGYSIFIYHVTPEQIQQLQRDLRGTPPGWLGPSAGSGFASCGTTRPPPKESAGQMRGGCAARRRTEPTSRAVTDARDSRARSVAN